MIGTLVMYQALAPALHMCQLLCSPDASRGYLGFAEDTACQHVAEMGVSGIWAPEMVPRVLCYDPSPAHMTGRETVCHTAVLAQTPAPLLLAGSFPVAAGAGLGGRCGVSQCPPPLLVSEQTGCTTRCPGCRGGQTPTQRRWGGSSATRLQVTVVLCYGVLHRRDKCALRLNLI